MATGLNLNRIVNVTLSIAPVAAGYRNFGAVLAIGSSPVIDIGERIRDYASIEDVLADFPVVSAEAGAAVLHFSQVPRPNLFYIGRWAQTATPALLRGGFLTGPALTLSNFSAVTSGSMALTIDGTAFAVSGLNLSSATNLNGVASLLQAAIRAAGGAATANVRVTWDGTRFTVTSGTAGPASSISFATATGAGTDLAARFAFTDPLATRVPGSAAESLTQAIATLADVSSDWYACSVATATPPSTVDHISATSLINAMSVSRIYAVTTQDRAVLDGTRSDDVASQLMQLNTGRSLVQFSSWHPAAVFSLMGRFATIDFNANNTTITLMFKQEPGVVAEKLTNTQANALEKKNCNVFVYYNNGKAILEKGVMSNGQFIDEVQNCDWYLNEIQTDLFNLQYQTTTKIPQDDGGMTTILGVMNTTAEKAVNNGMAGPGQWNGPGFGTLLTGDLLADGYYTFVGPIRLQSQANREKRVSPPFQQAIKLRGAVHEIDLAITVNR